MAHPMEHPPWHFVPSPFARGIHQKSYIINQTSYIKTSIIMNKSLWQKILNIVITVLTAIATTFGVTSCMGV